MVVGVRELRQTIELLRVASSLVISSLIDPRIEVDEVHARGSRRGEVDDHVSLAVEPAGITHVGVVVRRHVNVVVVGPADSLEVDLTVLLPGGPPNRTLQSVHSTVALAEQIIANPGLSARVLTADTRDTWSRIARGAYGGKLESDALTHLRKFGDRAMHDLKIEEPTPRQRPEMIIDALRPFVSAGATMQQMRLQESTAAIAALDELHRICPSPWRRATARRSCCSSRRA